MSLPWLCVPSWLLPLAAVGFNGRQTVCASELKLSWGRCQILPSLPRKAENPCSDGLVLMNMVKLFLRLRQWGFFPALNCVCNKQ